MVLRQFKTEFGEIDIGQHVWLKCCTALEGLIGDLDVPDAWVYRQQRFALPYKRPNGGDFTLSSAPLPWLLHLLPGLLRLLPGLGLNATSAPSAATSRGPAL